MYVAHNRDTGLKFAPGDVPPRSADGLKSTHIYSVWYLWPIRNMKLYSLDPEAFFIVLGFAFAFELLRVLLGFIVGREPRQVNEFTRERFRVLAKLADIKSVQLDFVTNSLLERKKIKLEKEIETLKDEHKDRLPGIKRLFRFLRIVVYAAFMHFFASQPLLVIDSILFWPYAPFASSCNMSMNVVTLLPLSGFAFRFLLRGILTSLTSAKCA